MFELPVSQDHAQKSVLLLYYFEVYCIIQISQKIAKVIFCLFKLFFIVTIILLMLFNMISLNVQRTSKPTISYIIHTAHSSHGFSSLIIFCRYHGYVVCTLHFNNCIHGIDILTVSYVIMLLITIITQFSCSIDITKIKLHVQREHEKLAQALTLKCLLIHKHFYEQ